MERTLTPDEAIGYRITNSQGVDIIPVSIVLFGLASDEEISEQGVRAEAPVFMIVSEGRIKSFPVERKEIMAKAIEKFLSYGKEEGEEIKRIGEDVAPRVVDLAIRLSRILLRRDDLEEAIKGFKIAIRLDPLSSDAHTWLAIAFLELSKGVSDMSSKLSYGMGSARELEIAIGLNPKNTRALLERGKMRLTFPPVVGDTRGAIEDLSSVLKMEPDNVEAHYWLGIAYEKKGDEVEAIVEFEKVLELDPMNEKAQEELEKLLY